MDFEVKVQNPSGCFSMSAFSPLQKLTLTFVASGDLKRIWTRELLSTCGNRASRTLDEAGLKSPCAKQKPVASRITNPIRFKTHLREAKQVWDRIPLPPSIMGMV